MKNKQKQNTTGLGKRMMSLLKIHGPAFFVYAVIVNILDEIVLPGIFVYFGFPMVGGLMVLADFDWFTYPLYFLFSGVINKK